MPMEDNLLRRVAWQMVSMAALRSRRMRMEDYSSEGCYCATQAVKAGWNWDKREWRWEANVFSRILEIKGRLGLRCRLLKSEQGFFGIGIIAAVLRDVGTVPLAREEWLMAEKGGKAWPKLWGGGQADRWTCRWDLDFQRWWGVGKRKRTQ